MEPRAAPDSVAAAARARGNKIGFDVEKLMASLESKKRDAARASVRPNAQVTESAIDRLTRVARDGRAAAADAASAKHTSNSSGAEHVGRNRIREARARTCLPVGCAVRWTCAIGEGCSRGGSAF